MSTDLDLCWMPATEALPLFCFERADRHSFRANCGSVENQHVAVRHARNRAPSARCRNARAAKR